MAIENILKRLGSTGWRVIAEAIEKEIAETENRLSALNSDLKEARSHVDLRKMSVQMKLPAEFNNGRSKTGAETVLSRLIVILREVKGEIPISEIHAKFEKRFGEVPRETIKGNLTGKRDTVFEMIGQRRFAKWRLLAED